MQLFRSFSIPDRHWTRKALRPLWLPAAPAALSLRRQQIVVLNLICKVTKRILWQRIVFNRLQKLASVSVVLCIRCICNNNFLQSLRFFFHRTPVNLTVQHDTHRHQPYFTDSAVYYPLLGRGKPAFIASPENKSGITKQKNLMKYPVKLRT